MSFLLDTNVISDLVAAEPTPAVIDWVGSLPEERLYLSVITVGVLKKGIEKLKDGRRRSSLAEWLEGELLVRFKGRILPLDLPTLLTWGAMTASLERRGRVLPAIDSLLAATAAQAGLTLVTRNTDDFEGTGIELLNPWPDAGGG